MIVQQTSVSATHSDRPVKLTATRYYEYNVPHRITSVHSSRNSAATQASVSSHDHLLDSLDITYFESGGNLWPLTTNDDDICLDFFDAFQEPIPGSTISTPSNIQRTSPIVEGHDGSPFLIKPSSWTTIDSQMPMGATSITLDDSEPKSTSHKASILFDAKPQVHQAEASFLGSNNLQPPESTNTTNYHGIIPPKRPEKRDPTKYISIIPTKDSKPLFKCCWHVCPEVTFWEEMKRLSTFMNISLGSHTSASAVLRLAPKRVLGGIVVSKSRRMPVLVGGCLHSLIIMTHC
ncbi:hypothetical protein M422DRAFT_245302 [Sphaerobolus stellatus SS14]|nr:hypothetical protein M422DRAFT_245302 [Sphaerobolus stellatus SS14]